MEKTLLIIAAGMGSRYDGLKQIDPIGPNGETIIDYSMFDAVRAGFDKIIFVIRRSFEDAFREKISGKLAGLVKTAYVYQELDSCLDGFPVPQGRKKPWGTGHAVLVAKDCISEPFAVINADDYYGPDSYKVMSKQLEKMANPANDEYAMVGYPLKTTLSDYGAVARGVCQSSSDMFLTDIIERFNIRSQGSAVVFLDEKGKEQFLTGNEFVSMNLWGLKPDIFEQLRCRFVDYLRKHANENNTEFFFLSTIDDLIKNHNKKVKILTAKGSWFGVTYREDNVAAKTRIRKLIMQGVYPEKLWE